MTKTYTGSCHCQAVRFEVELDLASGTGRCNCRFCTKTRNWSAHAKPEAFRLLAGEDMLTDYGDGVVAHHVFCKKCGVRPYSYGVLEEVGGAYVSIRLATLDDAPAEELLAGPIKFFDGLNDNWWNPPAETRHL